MTQQSAPVNPGPRTGWMPAPVGELMPLVTGLGAGLVLCTACELGLPDAVDEDPTPVEKIAARVGAEPDLVARLLRAPAAFDVFRPCPPATARPCSNTSPRTRRARARPSTRP
ncbi:methyltransferase family protein [Streptomyces sp. NRRL F-4489]|uniref:methyltransferase family protein n=1 Tax=Streptomyces sp. NRRL F-4489 TaxID=1609095 RepID=UPI000A6AA642|nr:methyltransferase dimerization domain-containing protein [Streptomyces sp. NRRL F-4489]